MRWPERRTRPTQPRPFIPTCIQTGGYRYIVAHRGGYMHIGIALAPTYCQVEKTSIYRIFLIEKGIGA